MSTINKKKSPKEDPKKHLNWMGNNSWFVSNPLTQLRLAASSCFFGEPMYYHQDKSSSSKKISPVVVNKLNKKELSHLRETLGAVDPQEWRSLNPTELMEKAIDEALDFNPEETLKYAVELRNQDFIRTTPQVIMVRAANKKSIKGTGLIGKYAPGIIKRVDELTVQLAYQAQTFGKPIPNSLKRAWKKSMESFNEYQLSKYRMENRETKLVDVMNVCHPKGEVFNKLAKGELKLNENTWESLISKNGSSKQTWEQAIKVMGHMALLKNLRNLEQNKVDPSLYLTKLIDTAKTGKQLPFRYYSAYQNVSQAKTKDAIETCLEISMNEIPKFQGKTISLCDNSGSARGTTTSSMGTMKISDIANLTAVITAKASEDGYVGVFGDRLEVMQIRKKSSIFDELAKVEKAGSGIGQATENGIWLFLDNAINKKEHWDNIFIYSDQQAGHGGLYGLDERTYSDYGWVLNPRMVDVAKLVQVYRQNVNKNVNVFLVQVAGYQDTLIPEYYNRTYILGGWGDGVLKFAGKMIEAANPQQNQQ